MTSVRRAAGAPSSDGAPGQPRELTGTLLVVVTLGMVAAGVLLAGPVGRAAQPAPLEVWQEVARSTWVAPEPPELTRFAIAIAIPVVIAALLLLRPIGRDHDRGIPLTVVGSIGCAAGLVLIAIGWASRSEPPERAYHLQRWYFDRWDLALAVLIAGVIASLALHPGSRARIRQWVERDRPGVALASVGVVGATALYALPAVYTSGNLADAPGTTYEHLRYTLADFAAFGNGATPLADFASQYSNLLPWVLHPLLAPFDYSPAAFTLVMAVLTGVALLAVWRTLVLAVGNEWVGAALYLPVLALSLRPTTVSGDERTSNASLLQIMPERYLLPFVTAWLCVRHVRGHRPHSSITVVFVATLALLNNPEFGAPALLGALGALLIGGREPMRSELRRVVPRAAAGIALAVLLVSAIVVVRSGSLPDPSLLLYFSRLFAANGFGLQSMPGLGLYLVLYVTFAGALILAAVRRRSGDDDRPLSAALAFSGLFGLGAGAYYVGRSNAVTMVALFPAWSLALALLGWTSVRWLGRHGSWRRLLTPLGGLALCSLVGLGLASSDLAGAPDPLVQVRRLTDDSERESPWSGAEAAQRYVAARTEPGEAVLILGTDGHLIALRAGVRNTSSIGHPLHIISAEQLVELARELRAEGGTRIFVDTRPQPGLWPSIQFALGVMRWERVSSDPASGMDEWMRDPTRREGPATRPHGPTTAPRSLE